MLLFLQRLTLGPRALQNGVYIMGILTFYVKFDLGILVMGVEW